MRTTATRLVRAGLAGAMLAPVAGAQVVPVIAPPPQRLVEGVEDIGPLNASLSRQGVNLRTDNDWEGVYRVPGQGDMLMRRAGGISAVFERSDYFTTEGRHHEIYTWVAIPTGVVFVIGEPNEITLGKARGKARSDSTGPDARVNLASRIESSLDSGIQTGPIQTAFSPTIVGPPLLAAPLQGLPARGIDNEAYRWQVLWNLANRETSRLEDSE